MTRETVSRWLDRAGFALLCVALLFLIAQRYEASEPAELETGIAEAGEFAVIYVCSWTSASLGVLLFLGRPLLRLRWWDSWTAFLSIGAILWMEARALTDPLYVSIRRAYPLSSPDEVVELIGLAFFLMGLIFLAAQWLVRRSERRHNLKTIRDDGEQA